MITIDLKPYAPLITSREKGEEIFIKIRSAIDQCDDVVQIEMGDIVSMTTFCAKQIFGQLYILLGADGYKRRIRLKNSSDDILFIIRIGITNAVRENRI